MYIFGLNADFDIFLAMPVRPAQMLHYFSIVLKSLSVVQVLTGTFMSIVE